jgi:hypothetical protein
LGIRQLFPLQKHARFGTPRSGLNTTESNPAHTGQRVETGFEGTAQRQNTPPETPGSSGKANSVKDLARIKMARETRTTQTVVVQI